MRDSRTKIKQEHVIWFKNIHAEFTLDRKGYSNPLTYIEGVYKGDKKYWAKVARRAGFDCRCIKGDYYFKY